MQGRKIGRIHQALIGRRLSVELARYSKTRKPPPQTIQSGSFINPLSIGICGAV